MSYKKSLIIKIIIVAVLIFIDLFSKTLFQNMYMSDIDGIEIIPNFLSFIYIENTGAAFSSFAGMRWFLIIFTIVMLTVFLVYDAKAKPKGWLYMTSFILILAGGVGNLVDRIAYGFVRDFISFSIFPPIFNIADALLCVGVVLFAIHIFNDCMKGKDGKNNSK